MIRKPIIVAARPMPTINAATVDRRGGDPRKMLRPGSPSDLKTKKNRTTKTAADRTSVTTASHVTDHPTFRNCPATAARAAKVTDAGAEEATHARPRAPRTRVRIRPGTKKISTAAAIAGVVSNHVINSCELPNAHPGSVSELSFTLTSTGDHGCPSQNNPVSLATVT